MAIGFQCDCNRVYPYWECVNMQVRVWHAARQEWVETRYNCYGCFVTPSGMQFWLPHLPADVFDMGETPLFAHRIQCPACT